jgi:hypothetical protein
MIAQSQQKLFSQRKMNSMKTIRTTDNHSPTSKLLFVPLKLCFLALLCGLFLADAGAAQLGTAFTYSGRLKYKNNPADGNFDLQVKLYDDLNAGNLIATYSINTLPIANGLFVMNVDFGSVNMFDGTAYWLELSARPSGNGPFQAVSPRQPVNPTPYAFFTPLAATANTANAAAANAISSSSIQNNAVTGSKIASGQVVKSLNGLFDDITLQAGANVTLTPSGNGLSISANSGGGAGWSLTGNGGTSSANFLGTTDNHPLELRVWNERALHLEWGTDGNSASMNTIAGSRVNLISNGAIGATIAGGGEEGTLSPFEYPNEIRGSFGTIGGGSGNTVRYGAYATIAGGSDNLAGYDVSQTGNFSSVGGGYLNCAQGDFSTVPGGDRNWAPGAYSFAAGVRAKAVHDRTFVWNDSNSDAFSTGPGQFEVFTANGAVFHTEFLTVSGSGGENAYIGGDGLGSDVQIGSLNPSVSTVAFYNANNNTYMDGVVRTLTIMGGSDLAEPFELSDENIPAGSVVIIDDNHPGQLVRSSEPYDTRVAGVVSGANGIHPGLMLHQDGVNGAGKNVALSGRVYVLADAATGPIKPGDLLTTSATAGHAMKVTDHARSHGAVLGKAMTGLSQGKGMVLVLVTLQ